MPKSFDEVLTELFGSKLRTDICREGSNEFNYKLTIAQELLQVTWVPDYEDCNLINAKRKVKYLSDLRKEAERMFSHLDRYKEEKDLSYHEQLQNLSGCVMNLFTKTIEHFDYLNVSAAYSMFLDWFIPSLSDTKYRKLLQLTSLYGFKMNLNIAIDKLATLPENVTKLLRKVIKPESVLGIELSTNNASRVKLLQDQTDDNSEFLKIVAIVRMFHGELLQNMTPSVVNASEISQLKTYGLLKEGKFVRVIGISALPESCNTYKYQLFNVGLFPLEPSTEMEKQDLDTLISFLLEASRNAISEETELIKRIAKFTKPGMGCTTFTEGDKLKIGYLGVLKNTITLLHYLPERSTLKDCQTYGKDLFYGEVDGTAQKVIVKIFERKPLVESFGNIFLPKDSEVDAGQYVEISLAGKELNRFEKRSPSNILHIFTQLLLELDNIHKHHIIHNDIKPSNIILLTKKDLNEDREDYYCKYIDFEVAKKFEIENGDMCFCLDIPICSSSGTLSYNAPEKELIEKNYIHPKSDIFSLGLVFIEMIIGRDVNKKDLENNNSLWGNIEANCCIFGNTQRDVFSMLQNMVLIERKQRYSAEECLKKLGNTKSVDKHDTTYLFFPRNIKSEPKQESCLSFCENEEKKRKREELNNESIENTSC